MTPTDTPARASAYDKAMRVVESEHARRFQTAIPGHDCAKNAKAGHPICQALAAHKAGG